MHVCMYVYVHMYVCTTVVTYVRIFIIEVH